MTIEHHPSDALLIAYAAGTTSEAEALALSAHLTFCPDCRAAVEDADAIGGTLLGLVKGEPMSAMFLSSALERLTEKPRKTAIYQTPRQHSLAPLPASLPRALSGYVEQSLSRSDWRILAPGVKQLPLQTSGAGKARLLRLKPGKVLPSHGHQGTEITVLLAGSYVDELGRFTRGDMVELDETVTHRPVAEPGETCIALVVTQAPLKFNGWIARIAQPFIGI